MDERIVRLETDRLGIDVLPALGGGLGRIDARAGEDWIALGRPWDGGDDPFRVALTLLAPWCNRVSGGGFEWRGRRHALAPTRADEALPLHGGAFAAGWRATERDAASVGLETAATTGPFRWAATARYALSGPTLTAALSVENRGGEPLPFGLGFHPWLRRDGPVRLRFRAPSVWLMDDDQLPLRAVPPSTTPEWDFSDGALLPDGFIDNPFDGWDGAAQIDWLDLGVSARIEAEPPLGFLHVYSPGADVPIFCVEPVSHRVDAHNRGGEADGLVVLAPGERLSASMRLTVETG